MKEIATDIEIHATPDCVWAILADFESYSEWNPFIRVIEGRLAQGKKLNVFLQPSGTTGMKFRPMLLAVDPNREIYWEGRLPIPGLFRGRHRFLITRLGDSRVRFEQTETFTGLMVPLLWSSLDTDTRRGFNEMNAALKKRAER